MKVNIGCDECKAYSSAPFIKQSFYRSSVFGGGEGRESMAIVAHALPDGL